MINTAPNLALNKRTDGIAIALILLAYIVAMLIMSPSRDFALLDDWTYANSVQHVVAGQGFIPSEYAQATLVAQTYWGAAFASVFGMNFTALTLATMVMSVVCAISFYLILRVLGFKSALSGLGVAILTLNPFYLYLSYTYMTEIMFTALTLVACLFYMLGMQSDIPREISTEASSEAQVSTGGQSSTMWLLLGGVFAALAFLTRQFGIAISVAAILWYLLARKLTITKALAVAGLPVLSAIAFYIWNAGFGTTFSGSVGREELKELLHPAEWAQRGSRFAYFALFLPGLTVPLWSKPKRWPTALVLSAVTFIGVFVLWQLKLRLVDQGQSDLDELSYTWLSYWFTNSEVLALIYCVGAALAVWLFYTMFERAWPGLIGQIKRKVEPSPALFFFLVGIILFLGTLIVSAGFLDRYWVPILPFVIAGALYSVKEHTRRAFIPTAVVLAIVGIFGVLVHLEDYASSSARWAAGRDLLASGVPLDKIENGYAWDGFYLYETGLARYPNHDVLVMGRIYPPYEIIDPEYVIDTLPRVGYKVITLYPYFSVFSGMSEENMFVLKREELDGGFAALEVY